tara:strand:- start:446 stop:1003 length:558 start_codon:yes stop_codon:yes gene_type:complete
MTSKIDLISNALILIGDVPINTFVGDERRKVVSRNLYDNIIENELTKHRWGFARKKAQLSLISTAPEDKEWSHSYELPSDLLSLTRVYPSLNYQVYGSQVYCNYNQALYADYTFKAPEAKWPAYFAKMIEYALAKDFSTSIRDSTASRQAMAAEYEIASRMARFTDSQQHPQVAIQHRPFILARS